MLSRKLCVSKRCRYNSQSAARECSFHVITWCLFLDHASNWLPYEHPIDRNYIFSSMNIMIYSPLHCSWECWERNQYSPAKALIITMKSGTGASCSRWNIIAVNNQPRTFQTPAQWSTMDLFRDSVTWMYRLGRSSSFRFSLAFLDGVVQGSFCHCASPSAAGRV